MSQLRRAPARRIVNCAIPADDLEAIPPRWLSNVTIGLLKTLDICMVSWNPFEKHRVFGTSSSLQQTLLLDIRM